MQSTLNAFK